MQAEDLPPLGSVDSGRDERLNIHRPGASRTFWVSALIHANAFGPASDERDRKLVVISSRSAAIGRGLVQAASFGCREDEHVPVT